MDVEIINDSKISSTIKIYPCAICKEPQLSELDLRNHLLTCVKEETNVSVEDNGNNSKRSYKCIFCGKRLSSASKLKSHNFDEHQDKDVTNTKMIKMKMPIQ